MTPRFSVCEFTTPDTTFEQDLALAAGVGTGIGICEAKLRAGEERAQLDALRASGLAASVCIPDNISPLPCEPAFPGPSDPQERLDAMYASLERLAPFDPDVVVVVTGEDASRPAQEAREIAVDGLRRAARRAAALGFELGIEPIRKDLGLHISIPTTVRETVEWIDAIGEPNIGVTYDVYHLFGSENLIEDTERYAQRINSVHVNDWIDPPRGTSDRALPGDGIINLAEIISALERGGFDGWYDLEIFAADGLDHDGEDALWRKPPQEIVRRGREGFDRVWSAAQAGA